LEYAGQAAQQGRVHHNSHLLQRQKTCTERGRSELLSHCPPKLVSQLLQGLGDYATYHMLFHVPKGLQLIATGTKVNENTDGKITTSEWKTDVPLPVVGFNLGRFTMKEATVENKLANNLTIDAYANTTPPDELSNLATSIWEISVRHPCSLRN